MINKEIKLTENNSNYNLSIDGKKYIIYYDDFLEIYNFIKDKKSKTTIAQIKINN